MKAYFLSQKKKYISVLEDIILYSYINFMLLAIIVIMYSYINFMLLASNYLLTH